MTSMVADLGPTGLLASALYFLVKDWLRVRRELDAEKAARLDDAKKINTTMLDQVKAFKEAGLLSLPSKTTSSRNPPQE